MPAEGVQRRPSGSAGTASSWLHGLIVRPWTGIAVAIALLGLAGLVCASATRSGTWVSCRPPALLLTATLAALAVGRLLGSDAMLRLVIPVLVAAAAGGAVLLAPDGLSGRALAGPLHYGNANGALCLLAVFGLLLAACQVEQRGLRTGLRAAAVGGAVIAVQTASAAASVLSLVLLVLSPLAAGTGKRRASVWAAGALPAMVLVATVGLGSTFVRESDRTSAIDRAVDHALSERRVALWSESLAIADEHPLLGVGPGRFAVTAPTAIADRDARWSHSLVLQTAAEDGWPAAAVLVLLLGCVFARLATQGDAPAVVGALGLSALLAQASIDYTAHFPEVTLPAALLLGLSMRPLQGRAGSPR